MWLPMNSSNNIFIHTFFYAFQPYFADATIKPHHVKSTPRAVPQKGVPHQFSSSWEIFQRAGWENIRNTP